MNETKLTSASPQDTHMCFLVFRHLSCLPNYDSSYFLSSRSSATSTLGFFAGVLAPQSLSSFGSDLTLFSSSSSRSDFSSCALRAFFVGRPRFLPPPLVPPTAAVPVPGLRPLPVLPAMPAFFMMFQWR